MVDVQLTAWVACFENYFFTCSVAASGSVGSPVIHYNRQFGEFAFYDFYRVDLTMLVKPVGKKAIIFFYQYRIHAGRQFNAELSVAVTPDFLHGQGSNVGEENTILGCLPGGNYRINPKGTPDAFPLNFLQVRAGHQISFAPLHFTLNALLSKNRG